MRWIFITLVILNIAFFGWRTWLVEEKKPARVGSQKVVAVDDLPKLQLLDELQAEQLSEQRRKKELLLMAEPEKASDQPLCTLVGPFTEKDNAQNMVENLTALDIESTLQDVEVPEGAGYWVYLPPEDSRKAALRRLRELQAKGIDSYVIPKGDLANGISFGMFSRQELADRRQSAMILEGYDAKIYQIKRSHSEIWVMLPAGEVEKIAQEFWARISKQESSLEKRQNYCLGVANGGKSL